MDLLSAYRLWSSKTVFCLRNELCLRDGPLLPMSQARTDYSVACRDCAHGFSGLFRLFFSPRRVSRPRSHYIAPFSPRVARLVRDSDSVHVVSVYHPEGLNFLEIKENKEDVVARLEATAKKLTEMVGGKKVTVATEVVTSQNVREALVTVAAEYDYLVIGSYGKSERTFLLGSVAQYILHHAKTNVIVIRKE